MKIDDVLNLLTDLNIINIDVWITGGWGVDALLGKQTRQHDDAI